MHFPDAFLTYISQIDACAQPMPLGAVYCILQRTVHRAAQSADLVPLVAIRRCLSYFAVEAVGIGRNESLRHQWCKASLVECLGGGESHCTHCAPMKCPLKHHHQDINKHGDGVRRLSRTTHSLSCSGHAGCMLHIFCVARLANSQKACLLVMLSRYWPTSMLYCTAQPS